MTNFKRSIIAIAATAAVALGTLVIKETTTPKEFTVHLPLIYNEHKTLKSEFANHDIRFGFSVGSGSFENPIKRAIIEKHAAIVGTEVATKMEYLQPKQGVFDYTEADKIIAYADELDIGVYAHALSWSLQNPNWLLNGTFNNSELEYILYNHVSSASKHFNKRVIGIDAANEGFLSCGPWCSLGTNKYIHTSFKAVRNGEPIFYNSIFPTRTEEDYALSLLDAKIIDGIGLQLHLATTTDWKRKLSSTDKFLARIRSHGGIARFSEVGVHQQNNTEAIQQALIYAEITQLAVKYDDIVIDFIVWGIVPPMWRGDTGLFDINGNPKPSYYAVIEELGK